MPKGENGFGSRQIGEGTEWPRRRSQEVAMGIGVSLLLIAGGAILTFAVET